MYICIQGITTRLEWIKELFVSVLNDTLSAGTSAVAADEERSVEQYLPAIWTAVSECLKIAEVKHTPTGETKCAIYNTILYYIAMYYTILY